MKKMSQRELKAMLAPRETPPAPADLAARIKAEIPDDLGLAPEDAGGRLYRFPTADRRRWLALAASLAVMVGGSFLAYRLLHQERLPAAGEDATVAQHRPAAPPVAAPPSAAPPAAAPPAGAPAAPLANAEERDLRQASAPAAEPVATARLESELEALGYTDTSAAAAEVAKTRPAESVAQAPSPPPEHYKQSPGKAADRDAVREEAAAMDFRGASPRVEDAEGTPQFAEAERRTVPRPPPPPPSPGALAPMAQQAPMPAPAPAEGRLMARIRPVPEPLPPGVAPPSTGGTAEPNDAPYGDVFFRGYGVNPFVDTEDDALSTFGLDVDTGSYTVVRRYLRDGHLPPPEAVRVEELINYFDYGDAAPTEKEFAIHAEGAPSIFGHGERYHLLRFNLHGREIDDRDRPPALLTFVVDVSGSMERGNRLGLVKRALDLLLGELRHDDRVSLVVYGSRGRVLLEPTGDRYRIRRALDELRPEGSTNAEEGLLLAYELAARHHRRGAINRVILCSDGVANVGRTSAEAILELTRRHADRGIELTTVGFGMGNYNDVLMERLADAGNGRYAYVDVLDEARRIFVENLTGTLQTIAAEARVQVEFNPEVVARYRLLGYENRDVADARFRDDTVDAGEIGAGHTVTALYEIKTHGKLRKRDEVATLRLRYGSIARGEMVELARTVTGADFAARWESASPALRLTSLVAEFAEILKHTYWAKEGDLDEVFRRAQRVSADYAGDREVADFVTLVGRAADVEGE